jgi:hypothetical protein
MAIRIDIYVLALHTYNFNAHTFLTKMQDLSRIQKVSATNPSSILDFSVLDLYILQFLYYLGIQNVSNTKSVISVTQQSLKVL